jgi:hypothetical protein
MWLSSHAQPLKRGKRNFIQINSQKTLQPQKKIIKNFDSKIDIA